MRKSILRMCILLLNAVIAVTFVGCVSNDQTALTDTTQVTTAVAVTAASASASDITPETTMAAATENLTFYYPGITETDIVIKYKEVPVQIKDNEGYEEILTTYFRTPVESDLQPIMSQNTHINSITFDSDNEIVIIDFTANFVSELNVGSSMEAAILRCLVNTVGGIYDVQDVIVTQGGQLYESGHIALQTGETFKVDYENMTEIE